MWWVLGVLAAIAVIAALRKLHYRDKEISEWAYGIGCLALIFVLFWASHEAKERFDAWRILTNAGTALECAEGKYRQIGRGRGRVRIVVTPKNCWTATLVNANLRGRYWAEANDILDYEVFFEDGTSRIFENLAPTARPDIQKTISGIRFRNRTEAWVRVIITIR